MEQRIIRKDLKPPDFNCELLLSFDFFGIDFSFGIDDQCWLEVILKVVPQLSVRIEFREGGGQFYLQTKVDFGTKKLYWFNGSEFEIIYEFNEFDEDSIKGLSTKILFALAYLGPPTTYFFHAGAVVFNGCGILIPGASFSGKTTLVKQLVKEGGLYYTDDCAVVDRAGYLRPNPIPLAVRAINGREFLSASQLGGENGGEAVKVKYILFTQFENKARWKPQRLSNGQGCLKLLDNLFFKPAVHRFPAEILQTMSLLVGNAEVFESLRGESTSVIEWIKKNVRRD